MQQRFKIYIIQRIIEEGSVSRNVYIHFYYLYFIKYENLLLIVNLKIARLLIVILIWFTVHIFERYYI